MYSTCNGEVMSIHIFKTAQQILTKFDIGTLH